MTGLSLTGSGLVITGNVPTPASSVTINTTTVVGGTPTDILKVNSDNTIGQYTLTGTGAVAVMQTSPTLITPVLGVAAGTSLALGGATIGTDALGVTGTSSFNGSASVVGASFGLSGAISAPTWTTNGVRYKNVAVTLTDTTAATGTTATAYTDVWGGNTIAATNASVIYTNYYGAYFKAPAAGANVTLTNAWALGADSMNILSAGQLAWNSDLFLTRKGAANLQLGAADAAAPVAQILSAQSVVTGTSNTVGTDLTIQGSRGTGTGVGGAIVFQVAPASTTGSTPNALVTALKIGPSGSVSIGSSNSANIALRITGLGATTGNTLFVTDSGGNANLNVLDNGSILLGRNAPATSATAGFVYIPVSAGQPTGTPTAQSGYVPIQFDSTNSQFWVFTGGSWKQPKTPAAAAIITWQ